MVEKDFMDITPQGAGGKGYAGLNQAVFQDTEMANINNNPSRLTVEGIKKKIELWKQSSNRRVVILYETMLKRCKSISPSGTLEDGRAIYSRDVDGSPKWVEAPYPVNAKPKEASSSTKTDKKVKLNG